MPDTDVPAPGPVPRCARPVDSTARLARSSSGESTVHPDWTGRRPDRDARDPGPVPRCARLVDSTARLADTCPAQSGECPGYGEPCQPADAVGPMLAH